MNKERLKIFLKLKLKEIGRALGFIGLIILATTMVILLTLGISKGIDLFTKSFPQVTQIIWYIIGIGFVGLLIYGLYSMVRDWIKGNWKKAGKLCKKKDDTNNQR